MKAVFEIGLSSRIPRRRRGIQKKPTLREVKR